MKWQHHMIVHKLPLVAAFCFILPKIASAQVVTTDTTDAENLLKQKIENYSEQTGVEMDITDAMANLEYFKKHPLNLNIAHYEDLQQLGLLDDIHCKNLLDHIHRNGKMLNIYELQAVEGFDAQLIEMLLPYVEVKDYGQRKFNFGDIAKYGTHDLMFRYQRIIEKQKGFADVSDSLRQLAPASYYLGSPDKLYLKYRFNYINNIKIGLTAEKDAGEEFFRGTNPYGFDFYSGYLNVNNLGIVKNVIVGDYLLQFGQGLTLWNGMSFGKSADAVGIKKSGRGIAPSNSVYESGFMRGAAITLGIKNFSLSAYYSRKKIDANLISDTAENMEAYISSLPEDGLHNTLSATAKEKTVTEQIMGGHFGYKSRALEIGLTAYATLLSQALHKEYQPYNQFEFSGDRNFNIGLHYGYVLRNLNFFGETSLSRNLGLATFDGMMFNINKYLSAVVAYRYYQRNYQSLYASAFSQSSGSSNESGLYLGIAVKPRYNILFSAYADVYHYPWLKYQVDAPSSGYDINAGLQYKPTKKIQIDLRYKFENSQKNTDDAEAAVKYLVAVHRQNYLFNIAWPVSNGLTLGNKVEVANYRKFPHEAEWGYFLAQDIRYRSRKSPLAVSLRFSVFDTPSYNSRIYIYENDVLYAYSLPSLYDRGIRYYVLLQCQLGRHVDLWLRFAQTSYNNKTLISSGPNEIKGSTQTEIKAQIRVKM
ncbi:MAG: helix-hairpin-helix domain-containing protein [Bacteroidota bacterium]